MAKLTPKQAAFVQEYLLDLNASQAAIRAGYSSKTANQQAARLLVNVKVAAAIHEAKQKRAERVEVSQDWVVKTLVANVERSMQAEPVYDREGNETGNYVYQGSVANRALELVGKHLGMFGEKGSGVNVNVSVDASRSNDREERFERLFSELDDYRARSDEGDGESLGGEPVRPGSPYDTPTQVS